MRDAKEEQRLKLIELKVEILKIAKTETGIIITSKTETDKVFTEDTITEDEHLKKLITKLPTKINSKLIHIMFPKNKKIRERLFIDVLIKQNKRILYFIT